MASWNHRAQGWGVPTSLVGPAVGKASFSSVPGDSAQCAEPLAPLPSVESTQRIPLCCSEPLWVLGWLSQQLGRACLTAPPWPPGCLAHRALGTWSSLETRFFSPRSLLELLWLFPSLHFIFLGSYCADADLPVLVL